MVILQCFYLFLSMFFIDQTTRLPIFVAMDLPPEHSPFGNLQE